MDQAQQAQLAADIQFIKVTSSELQKGLTKIYEVLERLAVLEADKQAADRDRIRVDSSLAKLFDLQRNMSDDLTNIKVSVAALKTETKGNTKAGDRWVTMFFSIASSIAAAVVVAKVLA